MRHLKTHIILLVVLAIGTGVYLLPLDPCILHLQLAFNETSFNEVLTSWQEQGITRYRYHFPADYLLLVTYGLLGYRIGRSNYPTLVHRPWLYKLLTWSLPMAALADAIEDTLHLMLTAANTSAPVAVYFVSGSAATIKFIFIGVFLICLTIYIIIKKMK